VSKLKGNFWHYGEGCVSLGNLTPPILRGQLLWALYSILYSKKTTAIQNKTGTLVTEPKAVLNRRKEYVEELYNTDEKPDSVDIGEEGNTAEDQGPDLLTEEILLALKEMKNKKAESSDNIPVEMLRCLDGKATTKLIDVCKTIYTTGTWPTDFVQSIMLLLEKKPNATRCENFRTITIISHAAKILLKVLQKRIKAKVDTVSFLSDDQFGFRKGTGTRDAIGTLRVLTERSLEVDRDVYVCFVDYEKAFDRVDWKKLMRVLKRLGVDYRDRRLIGNLYMGQRFRVRIEEEDSDLGIIGRGTRQGCPLSPLLFNIYIQEVLNETFDNVADGVATGKRLIQAICFADDQAMMASSEEGLQRIMEALEMIFKEYGMRINLKKTKVMMFTRGQPRKVSIWLQNTELEQVHKFCYLGSLLAENVRCDKEIKKKIAMAKAAFMRRGELLRGNISRDLKKRMVKALV